MKMRRTLRSILLIIMSCALLFTGQVYSAEETTVNNPLYTDVADGFWAATDITFLKNEHIMTGYPDGSFRPSNLATRAEVVSVVMRAKGINDPNITADSPFRDVDNRFWAFSSILAAYQAGIISGFPDGTFRPNNLMTRAEMASTLTHAFILGEGNLSKTFTDLKPDHWAYTSIQTLANNGIASGMTDGKFWPDNALTRAELAVFIARILRYVETSPPPVTTAPPSATPTLNPSPSATPTLDPSPSASVTPTPSPTTTVNPGTPVPSTSPMAGTYTIELSRWGISNNGTNPVETTAGLNNALKWINQTGYQQASLPSGTYLIDKDSRIIMVSNLTLTLADGAVIQKQANDQEEYYTLYIGPLVRDVTIRGGTFIGDRYSHDYSKVQHYGTHEWGYGIAIEGGLNVVIDDVKVKDFTGDSIYIATADGYVNMLNPGDFVSGSLDSTGKPVADSSKIRTNNKALTNFTSRLFQTRRVMQLSYPKGLDKNGVYDIYFYRSDDSLISSKKAVEYSWMDVSIPTEAAYFRAVFTSPTPSGVSMRFDSKIRSTGIIVKNSDISNSRRQGISLIGVEDVLITNNDIHDIKGTAPQSGIDAEGDVFLNSNFKIVGNRFYNNKSYDIILYDGRDALVEGKHIASIGALGITNTELFTNARVINNTFDQASVLLNQDVYAENNTVIDSWAKFTGPNAVIKGMNLTDSYLEVASTIPGGVKVYDLVSTNNKKIDSALVVNGKAAYLSNITINGPTKLRSITGTNAEGTVFDRLTINNYNGDYGLDLPLGIYNQCVFNGSTDGESPAYLNLAGIYEFNQCTFTGKSGLRIQNVNADVTIRDSSFVMDTALEWAKSVIVAQSAKKVTILNNTITAMNLQGTNIALIKINQFGGASSATDVGEVWIKGNRITTNIQAKGISTIDAGIGAGPYIIEDNVLTGAVLELRSIDVDRNNTVN
ncbi:MAG: S-layer homology domain-containing protein [Gorillibacterium sp.]|nr:S-layer homology domain-containing protein [Gorillibacterium sp.]